VQQMVLILHSGRTSNDRVTTVGLVIAGATTLSASNVTPWNAKFRNCTVCTSGASLRTKAESNRKIHRDGFTCVRKPSTVWRMWTKWMLQTFLGPFVNGSAMLSKSIGYSSFVRSFVLRTYEESEHECTTFIFGWGVLSRVHSQFHVSKWVFDITRLYLWRRWRPAQHPPESATLWLHSCRDDDTPV